MKLSKGFTFIEVAIAALLFVIIMAAIYPTYARHTRTSQRQETVRELDELAKQAQAYYAKHANYTDFSPAITHPVDGYAFGTVTTPDSFVISARPAHTHDLCEELSINQWGQHRAIHCE